MRINASNVGAIVDELGQLEAELNMDPRKARVADLRKSLKMYLSGYDAEVLGDAYKAVYREKTGTRISAPLVEKWAPPELLEKVTVPTTSTSLTLYAHPAIAEAA